MVSTIASIMVPAIAKSCSVGYAQTIPAVFTPGITLQRTSVSYVGHSYPYPGLLEVMYDIHTRTQELLEVVYDSVTNTEGTGIYFF